MRKKINNCYYWVHKNIKLCNCILIIIFLLRFAQLNYVNWECGLLTSGQGGVQYGADSPRYINGSEHLLNSGHFEDSEAQYSGYIVIISFVKMLGGSLTIVVIIQLFLALLSSYALFHLGRSVTGNSTAGIIAAGLYLSNPFITSWHLYIHTDSMYFSFIIISAWSICKAVEKRNLKYYLLSFTIVCISASIRPNGWILFPIMLLFFLQYSGFKKYYKYAIAIIVILSFFLSARYIPAFNNAIQNVPANKMLLKGCVVYGSDDQNLSMPQDSSLANKNWTSAYLYILKHPLPCFKLALFRVGSELFPIHRTWLSVRYKIRFLIWTLPAYILALFGFVSFRRKPAFKIALIIILAHLLTISLTHADHEIRFILYILPLIYLLCVCGLLYIYKKGIRFRGNGYKGNS